MEGWVDLGYRYPAMHRPGGELATFRSRVRRANHYTTGSPMATNVVLVLLVVLLVGVVVVIRFAIC